MESKQTGVGYLLLGLWIFGFGGLHRFYLGKPITGLLWFLTWGLFGLGTFVDLFLLPGMVADENRRLGFGARGLLPAPTGSMALPAPVPAPSPEQAILRAAKESGGYLTVAAAALDTDLSLRKAERLLERMVKEGHAERDVSEEGARLYVFPGLRSNAPFDLDKI